MKSAAQFVPPSRSLKRLRDAAAGCRGCDLYKNATQTVFGEGSPKARLVFVGEQPGDKEDVSGHPFVGPAGTLLRNAMDEAGIDPADVYLTNAVKHFKYVLKGKRRIHAKPRVIEMRACAPWLEAELRAIKPDLVVALGATAAQAIFGSGFRLTKQRATLLESPLAGRAIATVHPSSILRAPDDDARHAEYKRFVADLKKIAKLSRAQS